MTHNFHRIIPILLALVLAWQPTSQLVLEGRRLMQTLDQDLETTHFGSTSLLAAMVLKKKLSMNEDEVSYDPTGYNRLFFDMVTKNRRREMELLLIYMKTFEKDFRNKCKLAMLKGIPELRKSKHKRNFMARCEFFAEAVFRYQHMSLMFFNLEFIIKTFRVLVVSDSILMVFEGESEVEGRAMNQRFFDELEKAIAESMKTVGDISWEGRRLNMVDYFYGRHFMSLFRGVFDDDMQRIKRLELRLSDQEQRLLDWSFRVPALVVKAEKDRVKAGQNNEVFDDLSVPDVDLDSLYRYYGKWAREPFYDVTQFHMFQQAA